MKKIITSLLALVMMVGCTPVGFKTSDAVDVLVAAGVENFTFEDRSERTYRYQDGLVERYKGTEITAQHILEAKTKLSEDYVVLIQYFFDELASLEYQNRKFINSPENDRWLMVDFKENSTHYRFYIYENGEVKIFKELNHEKEYAYAKIKEEDFKVFLKEGKAKIKQLLEDDKDLSQMIIDEREKTE